MLLADCGFVALASSLRELVSEVLWQSVGRGSDLPRVIRVLIVALGKTAGKMLMCREKRSKLSLAPVS